MREIFDPTFARMVQAGLDMATITTWDPALSRRIRILVPVDVQAYVVPPGGAENTVDVTGGRGDAEPFAAGTPRAAGVHLHWAMPDALLAGRDQDGSLDLPKLPDRWVVVRTLQPAGARTVSARGWVIDAAAAAVSPLAGFGGTFSPGGHRLDPLDGVAGGSLLWTASYVASSGRFGFYDPLSDLPSGVRFEADQAVYTVAGWWADEAHDPLAASRGQSGLDRRLAELGWYVVHDGDDAVLRHEGPSPVLESPAEQPPATYIAADGKRLSLAGAALEVALPVDAVQEVIVGPALPRYASLLHGSVLGVPIAGPLPAADDRPAADTLGVAIGQDIDDVVSAFGAAVLRLDPGHRRNAETLVAAFTSGLIEQLGAPDALEDLAEREHGDGFWSLPGRPLPAARADRLRAEDTAPVGPLSVGRKGRAAASPPLKSTLKWGKYSASAKGSVPAAKPATTETSRTVTRPAPRYFRPAPPMVALRGARPNHRHHGDGLFDGTGRLLCRYPKECITEIFGVANGASVLPSLGSGAIPDEVLLVTREAVLLNPYGYRWFAPSGPKANRYAAEMVRLYGGDGRYLARADETTWESKTLRRSMVEVQIDAVLAEHSLLAGTTPSPVALTTWRQPWVPLWLEWRVILDGTDSAAGWQLSGLDLEMRAGLSGQAVMKTFNGRSPVGQGAAKALHESVRRWLEAERQRDATGSSTLGTADQQQLQRLGDLLAPLDLMSASLDGMREQLLGIPYIGVIERGADGRPQATGQPVPLFGGTLTVDALRLVDAFGRVLDIPASTLDDLTTISGLEAGPKSMRLRPRIQHLARWLWRLTDPAQPAHTAPHALREAFVDQLDPAAAVNPVAGFLLPDHIDEELEAFGVAGEPLGSITHDAVNGAVLWEPAPGRPVPPDAGPLADLNAQSRITGEIAAGLVLADATARSHTTPPASSALTAMLRAIDTTLWTVDTFAAIGSPTVAGLIGRPVAIVRTALRLDAPDDVDEVEVTAPGGPEARQTAFAALADQRFTVKLGALERSDDALLGFYVDDDYTRLHLVDRVVAALAVESGRLRGHLGLLGEVTRPAVNPLAHPYLIPDGTITVRPGQTVRLTLLMLPIGRVHLTSGVLPRKQLALSDAWVTPGLRRLVPSVRVGPVLLDPAEIRLPMVSLLGDKQTFSRRTGPLTWRHDPIVAATQTAYLPRTAHEAQEGWIRVTPEEEGEDTHG